MIREIVKEECIYLRTNVNVFNKSKLPYSSTNYLFIAKVSEAEMRQRNNKDTAEQSTPRFNNAKPTKKKSTLHKKYYLKTQ